MVLEITSKQCMRVKNKKENYAQNQLSLRNLDVMIQE